MNKSVKLIFQILLPVILIALALVGRKALIASKKPQLVKKAEQVIPRAEYITASPADYAPPIKSFGTVESYDETAFIAKVEGEVVELSAQFRVGLRVKAGDVLVKIDPVAYKAELESAQANVIIAESNLEEERVLGTQASEDWIASGRKLETASSFVLRKPQLASAQAGLLSAQALVTLAKQSLENTSIRAPYDGIIASRSVSLGDFASGAAVLGRLLAIDKAEVRLPLTADQLTQWRASKQSDLKLTIPTNITAEWTGRVRRTDPAIDTQNQVSYLIAEIDHPYDGETPLAVGAFINAEIPTPKLSGLYKLPESALVNDVFIWAITPEQTLQRLAVERLRTFEGKAYVRVMGDVKPPLKIITRPLTTFRNEQAVKPSELSE